MISDSMFCKEVERRAAELRKAEAEIRGFLDDGPEGFVEVIPNGEGYYYRSVTKDSESGKRLKKYISPTVPEQRQQIEELSQKSYYKGLLPEVTAELKVLASFKDSYCPEEKYKVFDDMSEGKKDFVKKIFMSDEEREAARAKKFALEIEDRYRRWHAQTLEYQNPYKAEDLTIETSDGHIVRSKSERMICDELAKCGYPYKYEASFHTRPGILYPDFMIFNKANGCIYIWEHFGMMDNSRYVNREFMAKIEAYSGEGYELGRNLIATFESFERPLQLSAVKKKIVELDISKC